MDDDVDDFDGDDFHEFDDFVVIVSLWLWSSLLLLSLSLSSLFFVCCLLFVVVIRCCCGGVSLLWGLRVVAVVVVFVDLRSLLPPSPL